MARSRLRTAAAGAAGPMVLAVVALVAVPVLLACAQSAPTAAAASRSAAQLPLPGSCGRHEPLHRQIDADYAFWEQQSPAGISEGRMRETVRRFVAPYKWGMHYGFIGGRAYMLSPPQLTRHGQAFLSRHLAYMEALIDLESRFGALIPDCEFVIVTADTPNETPHAPGGNTTVALAQHWRGGVGGRSVRATTYPGAALQTSAGGNPAHISRGFRDNAFLATSTSASASTSTSNKPAPGGGDQDGDRAAASDAAAAAALAAAMAAASEAAMRRLYQQRSGMTLGTAAGAAAATGAAATAAHVQPPLGEPEQGLTDGPFPVFRACKSDAFPANILIPSHDFYSLRYDTTVLQGAAELAAQLPWTNRSAVAYAQYDMHLPRYRHPLDPFTQRRGVAGFPLCGGPRGGGLCFVRRHFLGIAEAAVSSPASSPHHGLLDVRQTHHGIPGDEHNLLVDLHDVPRHVAVVAAAAAVAATGSHDGGGARGADGVTAAAQAADRDPVSGSQAGGGGWVPHGDGGQAQYGGGAGRRSLPTYLEAAAQHRVLVHLDGRGLSSSLERLLALGSVVLAEQSGYYGYFHRALKPYEHYLPWWEQYPDDIFSRLEWVRQNEEAAARLGASGAAFAREHLSAAARDCYWLALLRRHAAALQYTPSLARFPSAVPLRRFRDEHVVRMTPGRGQRPLTGRPFEP